MLKLGRKPNSILVSVLTQIYKSNSKIANQSCVFGSSTVRVDQQNQCCREPASSEFWVAANGAENL